MNNLKIYKPKKNGEGAASQWQLKITPIGDPKFGQVKGELFLEMAKQKGEEDADGNASFDWDNKIIMKLGLPDVSEMLLVLSGKKKIAGVQEGKYQGLYHQNDNGNAVLQFSYVKMDKFEGYNVRGSTQRGEEKKEVKHSITLSEGEIFRVLLERAIVRFHAW